MFGLIVANLPELVGFACVTSVCTITGYKFGRWKERRNPSKKKGAAK